MLSDKKTESSRIFIQDDLMIEGMRRVLVTGLVQLVPSNDFESKVIVTDSAKKLLKEFDAVNPKPEAFQSDETEYFNQLELQLD